MGCEEGEPQRGGTARSPLRTTHFPQTDRPCDSWNRPNRVRVSTKHMYRWVGARAVRRKPAFRATGTKTPLASKVSCPNTRTRPDPRTP